MKKRIIFINSLIIFFALSLFLIISLFVLNHHNDKTSKDELKVQLKLISELHNGENGDEVINIYKNIDEKYRITIITLDGEVLYDSLGLKEYDLHLDREEIINLGNVYLRYSKTFDTYMMYLATKDDGLYLRIAMPQKSIRASINTFLLIGFSSLLLITLTSIIVLNYLNKKALSPLNIMVNKLSILADSNIYYSDDIETISLRIDQISKQIDQKLDALNYERSKLDYIINNLDLGIIVIDNKRRIILVNDYLLRLKNFKKEEIINKDYIYLIRDLSFQEAIANTINEGDNWSFDKVLKNKIFMINISPIKNQWTAPDDEKTGAFITIYDVTEERNVEKVKREFFANASHELKTPLTTIIGYQQMISEDIISSKEEIKDASSRTIKEATRMHQIILEMLELSKLESKEEAEAEDLNIKEYILDFLDQNQQMIKDKNISLNLDLEDLFLRINNSHLHQLVTNIILNAIKYNIDGGNINIILKASSKEFIVKDTGIGIENKEQARVFERFYRVDKGRSKETGGTGLGLSIVKHICNLYQAKISLSSKLNQGTTIKVQFTDSSFD